MYAFVLFRLEHVEYGLFILITFRYEKNQVVLKKGSQKTNLGLFYLKDDTLD